MSQAAQDTLLKGTILKDPPRQQRQILRSQDLVWLLLFSALAFFSSDQTPLSISILLLLAIFQVAEPKIPFFSTGKGILLAISLKLLLCYLLIGWTGGVQSSYYTILLLPVVSAATSLNLPGTAFFTILACGAYVSFLLFLNWERWFIPPEELNELLLRVAFFPVVAFLVYQLARAQRDEMTRAQETAERLAETNQNLQRTEASLRRSERLAALGQLTAGLAHELRNPLGTIRTSADLLLKNSSLQQNETLHEVAGYIASEADRTNALISRFLDFARPLELHGSMQDLRPTLEKVIQQVKSQEQYKAVTLNVDIPDGPLFFAFDAELLEVALYNLIVNAIEASTPGQTVSVQVAAGPAFVTVSISDNGSGIDEQHRENIFNPFFTTKQNGTGLGLAIVSKIIDEHHGEITVQSQPDRGTQFLIRLPR